MDGSIVYTFNDNIHIQYHDIVQQLNADSCIYSINYTASLFIHYLVARLLPGRAMLLYSIGLRYGASTQRAANIQLSELLIDVIYTCQKLASYYLTYFPFVRKDALVIFEGIQKPHKSLTVVYISLPTPAKRRQGRIPTLRWREGGGG